MAYFMDVKLSRFLASSSVEGMFGYISHPAFLLFSFRLINFIIVKNQSAATVLEAIHPFSLLSLFFPDANREMKNLFA